MTTCRARYISELCAWFTVATMWQMRCVDHINTEFISAICCRIDIYFLQHSTRFFLGMFCYFFLSFNSPPTDTALFHYIKKIKKEVLGEGVGGVRNK